MNSIHGDITKPRCLRRSGSAVQCRTGAAAQTFSFLHKHKHKHKHK
eukprot:COSAG02_NODE_37692_length_438_cov_4.244838_1_plen_45_part_01